MKSYRITFSDGNTFVTGFNGTLTDAVAYYVGQVFWFENGGEHATRGVSVEEVTQ